MVRRNEVGPITRIVSEDAIHREAGQLRHHMAKGQSPMAPFDTGFVN